MMKTSIHPTAIVDEGAQLGAGTRVWHWAHISGGANIGERCSFGQNVFVGNDVTIGNNVKEQNNVSIYDAVTLEDDVFCGPSMVFTNVYNPRCAITRKDEYHCIAAENRSVYAPYTVQIENRDEVQQRLKKLGVPTAVHYTRYHFICNRRFLASVAVTEAVRFQRQPATKL
ncbi:MAG: hypothetical protein WCI64_11820 [Chlorobium sp.]